MFKSRFFLARYFNARFFGAAGVVLVRTRNRRQVGFMARQAAPPARERRPAGFTTRRLEP